jgi:hypothetical protein
MGRKDAIAWVLSACALYLRFSQAKTLSVLVAAAMGCRRISLAEIGRRIGGTSAKHGIKRVWRFIANERVEPVLAASGVARRLLSKRRTKPLLVSFDWTDLRGLQTLVAAAAVRGRAVPLCWASCTKHVYDGHQSRNAFEESLLLSLKAMLPAGQAVILLADRGFGRTELGRFCQNQGFSYAIRIRPDVVIRVGSLRVRLDLYPVRRGTCRLLRGVLYREEDPLVQNVVVRWKEGLPKDRDACWYLMTDLDKPARRISDLYQRRMGIEQLFRDLKNKRNGWSLRDTGITSPDRLDRLLLVLVLAYLLLVGLALLAVRGRRTGAWTSNNREGEVSLFQVGLLEYTPARLVPLAVLRAVLTSNAEQVPKWG